MIVQLIDDTPTTRQRPTSIQYLIFTSLAVRYQIWSNRWLAGYNVDGREGVG